jgi:hypothetical protein
MKIADSSAIPRDDRKSTAVLIIIELLDIAIGETNSLTDNITSIWITELIT